MYFEVRRSNDPRQPYYWRILASNGAVLAHSETYTTKQGCTNAIAVVAAGAAQARVHDAT
jgi:uncharacterized protein YegP (UPF0339 family)